MGEADEIVAAVRSWSRDDQIWWRSLLAIAPKEALLVGRLATQLGARPIPGTGPESDTDGAPPPR